MNGLRRVNLRPIGRYGGQLSEGARSGNAQWAADLGGCGGLTRIDLWKGLEGTCDEPLIFAALRVKRWMQHRLGKALVRAPE